MINNNPVKHRIFNILNSSDPVFIKVDNIYKLLNPLTLEEKSKIEAPKVIEKFRKIKKEVEDFKNSEKF